MQLSSLHVGGGGGDALLGMTNDENLQQKMIPFLAVKSLREHLTTNFFKGMIFKESWPKVAFYCPLFIDKSLFMQQSSKKRGNG